MYERHLYTGVRTTDPEEIVTYDSQRIPIRVQFTLTYEIQDPSKASQCVVLHSVGLAAWCCIALLVPIQTPELPRHMRMCCLVFRQVPREGLRDRGRHGGVRHACRERQLRPGPLPEAGLPLLSAGQCQPHPHPGNGQGERAAQVRGVGWRGVAWGAGVIRSPFTGLAVFALVDTWALFCARHGAHVGVPLD